MKCELQAKKVKEESYSKSRRTRRPETKIIIWAKSPSDLLQQVEPAGCWHTHPSGPESALCNAVFDKTQLAFKVKHLLLLCEAAGVWLQERRGRERCWDTHSTDSDGGADALKTPKTSATPRHSCTRKQSCRNCARRPTHANPTQTATSVPKS